MSVTEPGVQKVKEFSKVKKEIKRRKQDRNTRVGQKQQEKQSPLTAFYLHQVEGPQGAHVGPHV